MSGMSVGGYPRGVVIPFYNDGTTEITQGEVMVLDAATDVTVPSQDLPGTDPYGIPTAVQPTWNSLTTSNDTTLSGVVIADTPASSWGMIQCFGIVLAKVLDTAEQVSGDAYGAGATAGQLDGLADADAANAPTLAVQIGDSGVTSAGDLRLVFYHGLWSLDPIPAAASGSNPLGGANATA